MDQRVSMAMLGGVLGIVLVTLISIAAPPTPTVVPALPSPSLTPASSAPAGPPEMTIEQVYARFGGLGPVTAGGTPAQLAVSRVAPGDPVRWEPALTPGQNPLGAGPDQFYGYGVDSGIGCFASAEAVEYLSRAGAGPGDAYSARVQAAMFPSKTEIHPTADIPVGDGTGLNVVAFASGWGDGGYPSYFGLDAAGKPLVLLTNFGILDGGS